MKGVQIIVGDAIEIPGKVDRKIPAGRAHEHIRKLGIRRQVRVAIAGGKPSDVVRVRGEEARERDACCSGRRAP